MDDHHPGKRDAVHQDRTTGPDSPSALGFLEGGRNLGALMRAHDWSASPIGPPSGWPQSLRTALSIALNSGHPMFIAWGADLTFFYNDAYADILGAKHPSALGRRFRDIWDEIWPDILPLVERALAGEATWSDDLMLIMERNGYAEETYFTFSYSPIRDESGGIGGMFCACTETTGRVLAERGQRETAAALRASEEALRGERDRLYALFEHAPGFVAVLEGPEHRFVLANDSYVLLVGGRDVVGKTVRECPMSRARASSSSSTWPMPPASPSSGATCASCSGPPPRRRPRSTSSTSSTSPCANATAASRASSCRAPTSPSAPAPPGSSACCWTSSATA
jgi:PAS domain-containing protein